MKQELICIVCPKGCHLTAEQTAEGWQITGFGCPRGQQYGVAEMTNPTRVVTSTVRITGGIHPRLPVKTDGALPRSLVRDAGLRGALPLFGICKQFTNGEEPILPVFVIILSCALRFR